MARIGSTCGCACGNLSYTLLPIVQTSNLILVNLGSIGIPYFPHCIHDSNTCENIYTRFWKWFKGIFWSTMFVQVFFLLLAQIKVILTYLFQQNVGKNGGRKLCDRQQRDLNPNIMSRKRAQGLVVYLEVQVLML